MLARLHATMESIVDDQTTDDDDETTNEDDESTSNDDEKTSGEDEKTRTEIDQQLQQQEEDRETAERNDPNRFKIDISGDTGVQNRGEFPDLQREQEDQEKIRISQ